MIVAMNGTRNAEIRYRGRLFNVEVLSFADGRGHEYQREVVRHPGAVLVVPVLDESRLILIRNRRVAVDEELWEFPAGKLEPGEDPRHAAARELEEETGYQARRISRLGEFFTSPGFTDELMRVYVAEQLHHVGQRLEMGEHIHVETVSTADVMAMACDGRLRDGKSIAGLMLWHSAQQECRQ
jgi:ADP-ribose pyrophosphatase